MGDITTHAAIAEDIIAILRQGWPHEENYAFFELGNWLTDTSQFRDPYAMISAKMRMWNEARSGAEQAGSCPWYATFRQCLEADSVQFGDFAVAIMGHPGTDGALTQFFRDIIFTFGCEKFRRSPMNIPPAQFEEIYNGHGGLAGHFTQYYPHEHLDFPPWPHNSSSGVREPSPRRRHACPTEPAQSGASESGRRLLAYLDEQIEYVAQLLTWIENTWIRMNAEEPSADNLRTKREVLALFGHASHAVEDFYFHSNFVEIAWSLLQPPQALPTVSTANHHRQRRHYYRRRRSPAYDHFQLSPSRSYAASRVFTGSFGGNDVFHTFMDAFEGLAQRPHHPLPGRFQTFMDQLGTESGRRSMRDPNGPERTQFLNDWRTFADREAIPASMVLTATHEWDALSGDAFRRAIELDQRVFLRFHAPHFPTFLRGPFAFMTHLLCAAQQEHDLSDAASARLDAASREEENASANGASAENIGCHSLMAKDSPRKPPLRQPAINLATWVTCYIARVITRRLNAPETCAPRLHSGADPDLECTIDRLGGVDWLHLLQHFLCHPDECEEQWHLFPLQASDATEARNPALISQTAHQLRYLTPAEVAHAMARHTQERLEREYKNLERDAERDWQHRS